MNSAALQDLTLEHLKKQHPNPGSFSEFVSTCLLPARKAIRVNLNKLSLADFNNLAVQYDWILDPIPWCKDGFWVTDTAEQALGNNIYHLAGLFYLQEATSMLPVEALFFEHNPSLILDMAAAPGSKTTQLANYVKDSLVVANDSSSSRIKMLNANLIRCGMANYALLHQDGRNLPNTLPPLFDGILLDAPCGGEGTIRKDPKAWNNWSLESLESLSAMQKSLIESAWQLLAPGGRLVYSTCSLSREENQSVIEHLIQYASEECSLVNLTTMFTGAEAVADHEMLHIWPEVFNSEGFFIAAMEKSTSAVAETKNHANYSQPPERPSTKVWHQVVQHFNKRFGFDLSSYRDNIFINQVNNKQTLWLEPEIPYDLSAVKLQRKGIKLCQLFDSRKGLGINVEHEFCRSYGHQFNGATLELTHELCVAYFKGKNIRTKHDLSVGEVLLTLLKQPLGMGKVLKNGEIKNCLPRTLVHDNSWG